MSDSCCPSGRLTRPERRLTTSEMSEPAEKLPEASAPKAAGTSPAAAVRRHGVADVDACVAGEDAGHLARELGCSRTVAQMFLERAQTDPEAIREFLTPRLGSLTPPTAMADRRAAAERIAQAIRDDQPICVFGDYDCDGITSTAIMTLIIRELGGRAVPLLASRFEGGYGVSGPAVDKILATKAPLLVTCDCGSSDHVSLKRVRDAGVDIVVIDHHLVPDEPLPAVAFLNPHRPECGFPYKGLASCGLAMSIGAELRRVLNRPLDVRQFLDLVAIGSVADVAPLDGDNRVLVSYGLRALRHPKRPGLRALFEHAKIDGQAPISADDIGYRIAPRLNAPGRLGSPVPALELLLAEDEVTARRLAAEVEDIQMQRRELQKTIEQAALEQIEENGYAERASIVVGDADWNHGIVGIVAGRLVDRYNKPVIVVGFEDGVGRGSARGPEGSRLFDAISAASEPLDRFGGHQAAAGITVAEDKLQAFRDLFESACASGVASPKRKVRQPGRLLRFAAGDDPVRVVKDLEALEPCGLKNPCPELLVEAELLSAKEVGDGHLKVELKLEGGPVIGGFGYEQAEVAPSLGNRVLVRGKLRRDTWRGGTAVEMRIESIA